MSWKQNRNERWRYPLGWAAKCPTLQNSIQGLWLRVTLARATPARLQTISSPHLYRFGSSALTALEQRIDIGVT